MVGLGRRDFLLYWLHCRICRHGHRGIGPHFVACSFSLARTLLVLMLAFACAAAGFIAGSPLWCAAWLAAMAMLAGVSSYRASQSTSAARTAYLIMAAIASVGILQGAGATHPWTGSWLIGLAWTEASSGNGWLTWYGASAIGIYYAVCWSTASFVGGAVAWLIFGAWRIKR